jgi:polyribonucleotide nucleotidyltransferase
MQQPVQFKARVGDREIVVETGHLAGQAGGAITIREGDTLLLVTATMSKAVREGIDFFPLSVDYEERLYAVGRIPGNWFRREGRPPTSAILVARLTDRPIRPLFPKDMRNEVQVIITPLSHDQEHQADILSVVGASCALTISDTPWGGPIGAVRVGLIDGEFVVNPTFADTEASSLDLRMAGTRDAILMVECGADEIDEQTLISALQFGHQAMQPLIDMQLEMAQAVGKPKTEYEAASIDETLVADVTDRVQERIGEILRAVYDRDERKAVITDLYETVVAEYQDREEIEDAHIRQTIDDLVRDEVRRRILEEDVRPDGRDHTTIRPLSANVGISPRVHGSGLFQRGETQVLSLVTLGTPRDAQELDGLDPAEAKRYMHHYNFPPFSTGETWFLRGPRRREIGHGMLAETALRQMMPDEEVFPYTIRVVSEVLSSNGSTSMAAVCGSTLALMDAGVPIRKPVAGIAMGLVMEGDRYTVLTDIQGLEDHLGDMDFKVAGTDAGITALQMDIKIEGLSYEIMAEALAQARTARSQILQTILACIPEPRAELSPWAPRILTIHIDAEKIGAVIGKGGETVRGIQEKTGTKVDIQEDGTIFIASLDADGANRAREMIEALTEVPEVGRIYTGRVVRMEDYGLFVEILPGTDGMVHVSQLDVERVNHPRDVAEVGDEIMVMVTSIDDSGRIRLSRQAVLEGWSAEEAREHDRSQSSSNRGGSRGRSSGGRGGRDRGGRDRGSRSQGGGQSRNSGSRRPPSRRDD